MKAIQITLGIFLLSLVASADPVEVVLSTKITGVKDSKSLQNYVLKGNKARVYAKVQIHAKGYSNQGLRQWLERRLPRCLANQAFERTCRVRARRGRRR